MKRPPAFYSKAFGTALVTVLLVLTRNFAAPLSPERAAARLSAGAQARVQSLWTEARDRALARAINPDDYECRPTALDAWIGQKLAALQNPGAFFEIAFFYDALNWPTFYKLLMDNNATDAYVGQDGKQTLEMLKRLKDLQRFWNVYTGDVILEGIHGSDMANDALMVPFVSFAYGVPLAEAQETVDYVQSVISADPGLGFDNPIFTLNAYAITYKNEPAGSPLAGFSDKIVLGDGIIDFLQDIGMGANSPDMVMAHEFGHQVQFELGVFDTPPSPGEEAAATRRTELMADAFGAYFCAHARGAAFQAKPVVEILEASYLVGDCAFDFPGHHGTPNQRKASAQWAANLAATAQKQGKINAASAMLQLFDAQLPTLLAPDAP